MERATVIDAAIEALAREGVSGADASFELSAVDLVTRWVVARAVETAANRLIPDTAITEARTVGDLVDHVVPEEIPDDDAPVSADDLASLLGL